MPAERVVLIRHGESQWNAAGRWQGHAGPGLSARGHRQAALTARFLAGHESDVRMLVASDLPRVTETAQPTADAFGVQARVDVRLREIDVGWWSGLTHAEIEERDPRAFAAIRAGRDVPRGGAETARQLRDRVVEAVADHVAACDGGTMLLYCHGGPVRSIVGAVLGLSIAQEQALAGPGNCSRTVVLHGAGPPRLRCYNEMAHLIGL